MASNRSNSIAPAASISSIPSTDTADNLERLLIQVVRRHPILYNRSHKLQNSALHPIAHQDAWGRIAAELRLDVASCKTLWSCIKQKFIKYRKRISLGEEVSKEWPPYEAMRVWLDEHIQKRRLVCCPVFCLRSLINNYVIVLCCRSRVEMYKQICSSGKQSDAQLAATSTNQIGGNDHQALLDTVDSAIWSELPSEPKSHPANRLDRSRSTSENSVNNKALPSTSLKRKSSVAIFAALQSNRKLKTEPLSNSVDTSEEVPEILMDTVVTNTTLTAPIVTPGAQRVPIARLPSTDNRNQSKDNSINSVPGLKKNDINSNAHALRPPATSTSIAACHQSDADPTSVGCQINQIQAVDFASLERTVGQCIRLAEECAARQRSQDPDEVFGTLIASMVRELPAERRRSARVQILELTGDLLAKML